MAGDANFRTPNPTLAAMQTALNTLTTKNTVAEAGKTAQEQKMTERDTAEDAFDRAFDWVVFRSKAAEDIFV